MKKQSVKSHKRNAGYLLPAFVVETFPVDTFNPKMTTFARLAKPIKPMKE